MGSRYSHHPYRLINIITLLLYSVEMRVWDPACCRPHDLPVYAPRLVCRHNSTSKFWYETYDACIEYGCENKQCDSHGSKNDYNDYTNWRRNHSQPARPKRDGWSQASDHITSLHVKSIFEMIHRINKTSTRSDETRSANTNVIIPVANWQMSLLCPVEFALIGIAIRWNRGSKYREMDSRRHTLCPASDRQRLVCFTLHVGWSPKVILVNTNTTRLPIIFVFFTTIMSL